MTTSVRRMSMTSNLVKYKSLILSSTQSYRDTVRSQGLSSVIAAVPCTAL